MSWPGDLTSIQVKAIFGSLMNNVLGSYIDSGEGNFGSFMNNALGSYIDSGEGNFGSFLNNAL